MVISLKQIFKEQVKKLKPLEHLFHIDMMLFPLMANLYCSLILELGISFKSEFRHMHVHCIYKDYLCSFQGRNKDLYSVDFLCLVNVLLCLV